MLKWNYEYSSEIAVKFSSNRVQQFNINHCPVGAPHIHTHPHTSTHTSKHRYTHPHTLTHTPTHILKHILHTSTHVNTHSNTHPHTSSHAFHTHPQPVSLRRDVEANTKRHRNRSGMDRRILLLLSLANSLILTV